MDGKAGSDPRLTPAWGTEARRAAPDSECRLSNPGLTAPAPRPGKAGSRGAQPHSPVQGLRGGGSRGAHRRQAERARGPGRGTEGRPPPGLSVPPASRQGPRWAGEPGPTGKGLPRATPRRVLGGSAPPRPLSIHTPETHRAALGGAALPEGPRRLPSPTRPVPAAPPAPPRLPLLPRPAAPPPARRLLGHRRSRSNSRENGPVSRPPPPRPAHRERGACALAWPGGGRALPAHAQCRGRRGAGAAPPAAAEQLPRGWNTPGTERGGEGRGRSLGTEPS